MKSFLDLTKFGIIIFVLISGSLGFALSFHPYAGFDPFHPFLLLLGLYLLSSGSFILNQVQEWKIDQKMKRTQKRPIPSGKIRPWQAYVLSLIFSVAGAFFLYLLKEETALLGILTVVLYNGLYTLYWKKKWAFGAVPGAIPGALPVVIGYSVNSASIWTPECVYAFLIMFLWQMPHFWCLAIRYQEDYKQGGVPTLPVALGVPKTLYHMGLYVFVYVALAVASPWLVQAHIFYFLFVIPLALKVLYEFVKYFQAEGQKKWLSFFLWTNFSMIAFIAAPVIDKWIYILS